MAATSRVESGSCLKHMFGKSSTAAVTSSCPKGNPSRRDSDATLVDNRYLKDSARDRQQDQALDIELPIDKRPYPRFAGL